MIARRHGILCLALFALAQVGSGETIRTVGELLRHSRPGCRSDTLPTVPFDVTGQIVFARPTSDSSVLALDDGTGCAALNIPRALEAEGRLHPGCTIRAKGVTYRWDLSKADHVELLKDGAPPQPHETNIASVISGCYTNRLVRVHGIINDITTDSIDADWTILTVLGENDTLCCFTQDSILPFADRYLGAEVSVTGLCDLLPKGNRHYLGAILYLRDRHDISILQAPPDDPFVAPDLDDIEHATPRSILSSGRRRVTGRVIASWGGNHVLLRTARGNVCQVDLVRADLPPYGTIVDAAGFPYTDLFNLNLSRAIWRGNPAATIPPDHPIETIAAEGLLTDRNGKRAVNSLYHGWTIRFRGHVLALPASGNNDGIMRISCGDFIVAADVSSCPEAIAGLSKGCKVELTGVCRIDSVLSRPTDLTPGVTGFTLLVRKPEDVRILAHPPWWTPVRLLAIISTLLVALSVIIIWNILLRRLAERRGRALAAENIARAESDLRVCERTRLAVELHDSIVQNLSGVSLELDAARNVADRDHAELKRHLNIAARTLTSCRGELRNCMWDLRNQALEDERIDDAIRRTLAPHLCGTALSVRFDVPREIISDNTVLALLRIIRELTVNAIRHGRAKSVAVEGRIDGRQLVLAVRDDGCGFDPSARPGIEEGHFGLQGVCERVESFNGEVSIRSAPDQGTEVTMTIPVPSGGETHGETR